jgi:hypothetical protein
MESAGRGFAGQYWDGEAHCCAGLSGPKQPKAGVHPARIPQPNYFCGRPGHDRIAAIGANHMVERLPTEKLAIEGHVSPDQRDGVQRDEHRAGM